LAGTLKISVRVSYLVCGLFTVACNNLSRVSNIGEDCGRELS